MAKPLKDKKERPRAHSGARRVARERKYRAVERGTRGAPGAGSPGGSAVIDAAHVDAVWRRWVPSLEDTAASPPRASLDVVLGEAAQVALLYQTYWAPTPRSKGPVVPGFQSMAAASVLHAHSGYELLELVTAIVKADAEATRANEPLTGSTMARAQEVLREIKTTLEFVFDDGEHTQADEQLSKVAKTFPRPRSHDLMAGALTTYAELGNEHRVALGRLPVFDLGILDEALTLAGALRRRSGEVLIRQSANELWTRNQLLALLQDRMARIRRCARLLFRDHPEIARRFTSEYQRVGRKARRQRVSSTGS